MRELPVLSAPTEVLELARAFLGAAAMPRKAALDALHVALAAVHETDFLLAWNCAHIANATIRPRLEAVCRSSGYQPPVICTPLELFEEEEP